MIQYKVFETKEDWAEFRSGLFTASEIHRLLAEPKEVKHFYYCDTEITQRKYNSILDKHLTTNSEILKHLSIKTILEDESGLSKGAKAYVLERVAEMLAPKQPDYYNSSMEHGNETEPQAVIQIAERFNMSVNDDDFIYTSVNGFVFFWDDEFNVGGTPDVILKSRQMIAEVKCPLSKTHLEYMQLMTQKDVLKAVPDYYAQMQLNMYLTHTDKCLFVSYDDRFYNKNHHYHQVVVNRDENYIENMLEKAKLANDFKQQILTNLNYGN